MLENLIKKIKEERYVYSLVNLHHVNIEFTNYLATIIILDNCYKVYIIDNNDKLIETKEYKYPKNIINYIVKVWEQFN